MPIVQIRHGGRLGAGKKTLSENGVRSQFRKVFNSADKTGGRNCALTPYFQRVESKLILDTNIVLDLFVFNDPDLATLKPALLAGLENKQLNWIATTDMRIELERVLTYPKITPRMAFYQVTADDVLAKFDQLATLVDPAPKAKWACKDPDDQRFIDLAVQHQATLLSKDQAVLCMAKRLLTAGAVVQKATDFTPQIGI